MQAYEIIANKVYRVGITNAELARRAKIDQELLRRSLIGERNLKADEFISLCVQLDLGIKDFAGNR